MTTPKAPVYRDDVLNAFAVETETGRAVLERYLQAYPQYAAELVDLSRELSRTRVEDEGPLTAGDQAFLNNAWTSHVQAGLRQGTDVLTAMSVDQQRAVAERFDIPRQVVTAFRERKVSVESVPRRFARQFAALLNSSLQAFLDSLALSPIGAVARSYKADEKPGTDGRVSLERILIEAGVSEEKRASLLADGD
jgi:hypothetical protein